jgi:hypothetical protein
MPYNNYIVAGRMITGASASAAVYARAITELSNRNGAKQFAFTGIHCSIILRLASMYPRFRATCPSFTSVQVVPVMDSHTSRQL